MRLKEVRPKDIKSDRIRAKETRGNIPSLEELIAQITPENCHPAIDWGPDVGREKVVWQVPRVRRIRRRPSQV